MIFKTKILLVNLKYPSYPFPHNYMPVGLGYIAEQLLQNNIPYSVCDLNFENENDFFSNIEKCKPEFIGFSLMSLDIYINHELIKKVKDKFPYTKIVVGGPHISFIKEKIFIENPNINFALVHEGEYTLIELLRSTEANYDKINGLIYITPNGEIKSTESKKFDHELDKLSFPTYQGFPLAQYGKVVSIASSRGCPYACTFCGAHLSMGKSWRSRSPESILSEIKYWHNRGITEFDFVDSNFFFDKKRVINLCDLLGKSNITVNLSSSGMRANDADPDMIKIIKRFGFKKVAVGIESANDDILKNIKKGESLSQIANCLKTLNDSDIKVIGFFIIGLPGETIFHVLRSFLFALKFSNMERAYFFNINPLFETPLFEWAKKNGHLLFDSNNVEVVYANIGGMSDHILIETPNFPAWQRKLMYKLSKVVSTIVRIKYQSTNYLKNIHFQNSAL